MLNKLNKLSVAAYVKASSFAADLKNDERGLSGVVVAVLLILIAVLAIVMLWGSLSEWLDTLWSKIALKGNSIEAGSKFNPISPK